MGLETLFRFPNAWTSFAPGFGVHLFEGRITIADMDRMEELGMAWRAKNPGRVVEMVVIFPSSAATWLAPHYEAARPSSSLHIDLGAHVEAMCDEFRARGASRVPVAPPR